MIFAMLLKYIYGKFRGIFKRIKRLVYADIDFLVLITGQACTLKCKHCANFSPYLSVPPPPQCDGDVSKKTCLFYRHEDIRADLDAITKTVGKIRSLQIQGGEFFMHPDAVKIIRHIKSNPRIINTIIATNGTIVPSDDVLREIKNSRISSIRISDYGFNAEKVKLIKNKLEAYGIQNSIYHFVTEKSMWADCGGIDMPKLENHVVERLFRKCLFKGCLSVENGFVSRCSRATVAHLVQKFNLEKKDGVNVRNNFTKREFLKFAYGNYPVTACYYCFGTSHKEIPAAEQFTVEELRQLKQVCYEI